MAWRHGHRHSVTASWPLLCFYRDVERRDHAQLSRLQKYRVLTTSYCASRRRELGLYFLRHGLTKSFTPRLLPLRGPPFSKLTCRRIGFPAQWQQLVNRVVDFSICSYVDDIAATVVFKLSHVSHATWIILASRKISGTWDATYHVCLRRYVRHVSTQAQTAGSVLRSRPGQNTHS
jgi:hypothetical protein